DVDRLAIRRLRHRVRYGLVGVVRIRRHLREGRGAGHERDAQSARHYRQTTHCTPPNRSSTRISQMHPEPARMVGNFCAGWKTELQGAGVARALPKRWPSGTISL